MPHLRKEKIIDTYELILDFRSVASFQNESVSKSTGSINDAKFYTFHPPL